MTYTVRSLPRAEFDAQSIYDWICERSADGGRSWWQALEETFARLRRNPGSYACAPEAGQGGADVRQILFKTRQGRFYRVLFIVVGTEVRILRIRGPGQPALTEDELK